MLVSRLVKAFVKLVSGIFTLFILLSDSVFDWFISLPYVVTWSGAVIFTSTIAVLVIIGRRWPNIFRSYRASLKNALTQLHDSLFDFVIVALLIRAFYPLDVILLPYYRNPWVLLTFGLQGGLLLDLWSLKNELDWGWRAVRFLWTRIQP